jgi:acetyl esterase/lipase
MTKILYAIAILLIVGGLAYHFAALQIFNALVPKDADSLRKDIEWAYGPDPRQKMDMYVPRQSSGPLPIVLFVHGGSWAEGDKSGYAFVGRALAAKGYLTLVMNYRLHPKNRYPDFVYDVALALRWTADNAKALNGDPDKIFAMGHSAGAYNIAMAVLDQRYDEVRPKIAGVITLAGPFDFLPLDTRTTIKVFGDVPDLPSTQPVNHARKDAPPFLILHGGADTTVFPRNATALDAALKKAGVTSTVKIYAGVSHAGSVLSLAKPLRRRTTVLDDAAEFIRSTK